MRWFVTGTSTEVGKTTVAKGILARWSGAGIASVGLKPVETGVAPTALDEEALAKAAGRGALPGAWYRAELPLSPHAVALSGGAAAPPAAVLAAQIDDALASLPDTRALVEGAGGLAVPLNDEETWLDVVGALAYPVILVGPDRLGVQSDVLLAADALMRRGLPLAAVVLNQFEVAPLALQNEAVLNAHLATVPVVGFAPESMEAPALAAAARPVAEALVAARRV